MMELAWFKGVSWVQRSIKEGEKYIVFGKVGFFMGKTQIIHPEIEPFSEEKKDGKNYLEPVYPTTEKLKAKGLTARVIAKLTYVLLNQLHENDIPENLPDHIVKLYRCQP